jgi:hypothetical protein
MKGVTMEEPNGDKHLSTRTSTMLVCKKAEDQRDSGPCEQCGHYVGRSPVVALW